jgi:hypothetical protein
LLVADLAATFAGGGQLSRRLQNTSKVPRYRADSLSATRKIALKSRDAGSMITADTAASKDRCAEFAQILQHCKGVRCGSRRFLDRTHQASDLPS